MEAGYRTPLVDCFRRGEVALEVRMLAAGGVLAPRAHEQLALLVLLTDDSSEEVRHLAKRTLDRIPVGPLAAFLARSDVGNDLREFFSSRGVVPAAVAADETSQPLIEKEVMSSAEAGDEGLDLDPMEPSDSDRQHDSAMMSAGENEEPTAPERLPVIQRLAKLSVPDRMKRAFKGSREERAVLIRDRNKLVSISVLSSPKLTEAEIESFAKMTGVTDEVLRIIGTTRAWIKNYLIVLSLCRNPKTPVAISLTQISRLSERDIRMLAADRNVPEPVRIAARKVMMTGESRRR